MHQKSLNPALELGSRETITFEFCNQVENCKCILCGHKTGVKCGYLRL